jgi:mono/diheme cytochrome c family protein
MRFLAITGAFAICAAIVGLIYFLGGFFSVAAARANFGLFAWTIGAIREASVAKHADMPPPAPLDDLATVRAGARLYARDGCADCHGGPGVAPAKFAEGLLPRPPDLKSAGEKHDARRLFWIVKNGITLTGMPAYGPVHKDDNALWSVVGFVRNLRWVSAADYGRWSAAEASAEKPGAKPEAKAAAVPAEKPRAAAGKK